MLKSFLVLLTVAQALPSSTPSPSISGSLVRVNCASVRARVSGTAWRSDTPPSSFIDFSCTHSLWFIFSPVASVMALFASWNRTRIFTPLSTDYFLCVCVQAAEAGPQVTTTSPGPSTCLIMRACMRVRAWSCIDPPVTIPRLRIYKLFSSLSRCNHAPGC